MKKILLDSEPKNLNLEEGEQLILCPVCKFENTHFGYTPNINKVENYLAGHRGGGYTIPMWCEQGHHWDLIISHHKGWSYITTNNFEEHTPIEPKD